MMPSADALRTLVAGGGQAGGQFLRAMRYGQCAERFDVVALADIDPGRLAETGGSHTACTDLDQALRREHVVVCVNEEFHSGVLDAVPEQAPARKPGGGPRIPCRPSHVRRARDLARRNHLRHLQLPPDARHRAHHGHRDDDDQTDKPWAAPSGDPGAPWPPPAANPPCLPSA